MSSHIMGRAGFEPAKPKQQIYSLPTLTTCIPTLINGADQDRTDEPPACKAGALPTELRPHSTFSFGITLVRSWEECATPNWSIYDTSLTKPHILNDNKYSCYLFEQWRDIGCSRFTFRPKIEYIRLKILIISNMLVTPETNLLPT